MITPFEAEMVKEIQRLKQEKEIYIIAHYYPRGEVQDIADFVGDSYRMAVMARESPFNTILVCGVDFMAETAAILCPNKTILTPEPEASCPMADSISVEDVLAYKREHPDSLVVAYVNTPAEIKAVSDVCCTSSNAVKIINQLPPEREIYFVPDRYLASYIGLQLGRKLDAFPSQCPIHAVISRVELRQLKELYPGAPVLLHPECHPDVIGLADYVGSTGGMVDYVNTSQAQQFIIGTECGILHSMQKTNPGKQLILASSELICPNMKSINLQKILYSLKSREKVVQVEKKIRVDAARALEKMIAYAS